MDGMPGPLRADLGHLSTALDQVLAESGGSGLVTEVEDLRRATIRLRQARSSAAALATQRVVDLVASLVARMIIFLSQPRASARSGAGT